MSQLSEELNSNRSLDHNDATSENNASLSASAPLSSSCPSPGFGVTGNQPDNRTESNRLFNDQFGLKKMEKSGINVRIEKALSNWAMALLIIELVLTTLFSIALLDETDGVSILLLPIMAVGEVTAYYLVGVFIEISLTLKRNKDKQLGE